MHALKSRFWDSYQPEKILKNFQRRSIKRLKIHPLRPSRCGLSYHSIVPLEDNARAKPDIMASYTRSAIWPVIKLEDADSYSVVRTYVDATAESECKKLVGDVRIYWKIRVARV